MCSNFWLVQVQKTLYLCAPERRKIMKRLTLNHISTAVLGLLFIIVIVSVLYTNYIAEQLAEEERKKMELWAEATKQFIIADENENIDFLLQVMEGNTTIPVYMVDADYHLLMSRNVREPKRNVEEFYADKIATLRESQQPIKVQISDDIVQYIYYEDSYLLKRLYYFPYIEFSLILTFVIIAVITLLIVQRSEQNSLWIGLSKETAHQLGTPISSLNAWNELLKARYPDDALLPQMDEDIKRLQMIAERFSKIGSQPEVEVHELVPVLQEAVNYMRARTSSKVEYILHTPPAEHCEVKMCVPLFEWVIENLCKNAIDSMEGVGTITISTQVADRKVFIDVADTGKGIDRHRYKTIFRPGYTSKKRGWGLGLSLSRRIIEDYHHGKLFVKQSQIGVGTTFRIVLELNH